MIRIFTDGAAQGNPGPGGYGTILKFKDAVRKSPKDSGLLPTTGWNC